MISHLNSYLLLTSIETMHQVVEKFFQQTRHQSNTPRSIRNLSRYWGRRYSKKQWETNQKALLLCLISRPCLNKKSVSDVNVKYWHSESILHKIKVQQRKINALSNSPSDYNHIKFMDYQSCGLMRICKIFLHTFVQKVVKTKHNRLSTLKSASKTQALWYFPAIQGALFII